MNADTVVTVLTALGALLAALGAKELIQRWVDRRGVRADTDRAQSVAVAEVSAAGNLEVLKVLLTETKERVDSYEKAIADLKASHSADIRELKTENRNLERQVADLRLALQEYQLGNRVPRGYVLVPVSELRRLREMHPGLLEQRWYPGEMDSGMEGPSINARITRIEGPTP